MGSHFLQVDRALRRAVEEHGGDGNGFSSEWLAEIGPARLTRKQINRIGRRHLQLWLLVGGIRYVAVYNRGNWLVEVFDG